MTRGKSVANGDNVVIVTLNNSSSARAVIAVDPNGWHRFNN